MAVLDPSPRHPTGVQHHRIEYLSRLLQELWSAPFDIGEHEDLERVARRIRKTGRALWRPPGNGSRPYVYEPVDWDLVNQKAQEMLAGSRARIVDQIQAKERVGKRPSEEIDLDAELRALIDGLDDGE